MLRKIKNIFMKDKNSLPENICMRKNFIFIHIPKNAGTSISHALGLRKSEHFTASYAQNILKNDFYKMFKFCFVRNPWDRFLSLYKYARMAESYYHSSANPEKAIYGKHLDYDLLKNATLRECAYFLIEKRLKHDQSWNHWLPQCFWLTNQSGKIIVDYIGKVEDLPASFDWIKSKLGIRADLERKNVSRVDNSYRQFFDKETRGIVADYYHRDIKLFGYEF